MYREKTNGERKACTEKRQTEKEKHVQRINKRRKKNRRDVRYSKSAASKAAILYSSAAMGRGRRAKILLVIAPLLVLAGAG